MPHLLRRCIVPCFRHGVYCTSPACTAVSPVRVVLSSSYCLYARCRMSILAAAALASSCYKNVWNTACLTCCEDASCRASGMVYIAQVQLVRQFLRYLWFRLAASSSYCLYARCHMSILAVAPLAGSCYKNMWKTACLTCCEDASCRASGMVYIAQVQLVRQFLRCGFV